MVDVDSFLDRIKLSKADAMRKINGDPKSSLLTAYEKGRSNPSYDVIVKLIQMGITAEELLGKELANKLMENSGLVKPVPKDLSETDDFKNAVQDVILELKKNGKI